MVDNNKKSKQLGMSYSSARSILARNILFSLLVKHNENICYRCGKQIESVKELSVEHKEAWLDNNTDLFWDLNNIAFSHNRCNSSVHRVPNKKVAPEGKSWCAGHKDFLPTQEFGNRSAKHNGKREYCHKCRYEQKKKYKKNIDTNSST